MTQPQPRSWGFAGFRLDRVSRELAAADGTVVALAAKAFEVLVHLIEHRDRVVTKDELLSVVWSDRVVEENTLTQAVSTLRRALGTGAGDHRIIMTVPGRGYRFVAALDGPDAPVGERTPSTESAGPRGRLFGLHGWRRLALAIALLGLILATTTALRDRGARVGSQGPGSPPPTLAVLPFRGVAGTGDGEVDRLLGLGMAETLIARLSRSTSLRVLSLGSVQAFDKPRLDPLRAGVTLGADFVVEGSTQRVGDSIRVNARLVSVPDGRTVWAGTFDEAPGRVFTLQDAIAGGLASGLSLQYPVAVAEHRSPCDGPDEHAYRAYLRGRHLMFRPDRFRLPEAIAAFGEAVDRDPLCARAWAGISFAWRSLAMTADADPHAAFAQARAAVDRALAIDPASAEAHASRGVIEFWHEWDWAAAEASLRRAIELDGNLAEAHYALAHLLNNLERHDEAEPHARNATLLDPMSPLINTIVASFFINSGEHAEAGQRLEQVLVLHPDFWLALYMRGSLALARGDIARGLADLQRADEACGSCGHAQAALVEAYRLAGDAGRAERVLAAMHERAREGYFPATQLALAHEALGQREQALDLLERGYAERDLYMSFLAVDKRWSGMYREPRFVALAERMNLRLRPVDQG